MRTFDARTLGDTEARLMQVIAELRAKAASGHPVTEADLAHVEALIPSHPLKVQIQTTTRCNAACSMCPYPEVTGEPGFAHALMSEERYLFLLEQLRPHPIDRLSLFLMNEPLLDRRLARFLELARKRLPGATLSLFTNGSALDAARARELAAAGLDEICISVHGFDAAAYEQVMVGLSFERARKNLRAVLEERQLGRLGSMQVHLIAGDQEAVRQSAENASEAFADEVLWKAFSNEREAARVRGNDVEAAQSGASAACQRPFVKLYVLTTGECVLCNVDWRKTEVMGRLGPDAETLKDVWNGSRYRAMRRAHLQGALRSSPICHHCDYASRRDEE